VRSLGLVVALSLAFVLVAFPAAARSIDDPTWDSPRWPKNTLTTSPLMLVGAFNLQYERAITERIALYAGPLYLNWDIDDLELDLWMVDFGARFFASGQAPEGFFVSPGVMLAFGTVDDEPVRGSGWLATFLFGYTWLLDRTFDISVGIGGAYVGFDKMEAKILPFGRAAVGAAF